MFGYLRWFSIISLVLVVGAAIGVGMYFRSIASEDLRMMVERQSAAMATAYKNTIWVKYRDTMGALAAKPVNEWAADENFQQFSRDTFRFFEGVPVAKLNFYTVKGELFLSTDQAEIRAADNGSQDGLQQGSAQHSQKAFVQALQGETSSVLIPEGLIIQPDRSHQTGSLIQTFIPLLPDDYVSVLTESNQMPVDAVIEVYYEITSQSKQLWQFQLIATAGIMAIFLLLLGALYYTSRKAEAIIAKQHEANMELQIAAARAEASNQQKSQFLANISHELRTPLNAIIGFSEIIKSEIMGKLGNEKYIGYINDIHSSGVHLLSLINDILDFSKAEAGKLELELAEVDANRVVKSCVRLVSTRAEEASVQLHCEVPKDHMVIHTDAKKLKQVLLNLLSNSVKFTPAGGSVTTTLWFDAQENRLKLQVKDTGIGMAPKDIPKAMAPFGQVDSELSRRYEGTGLGLPLTKKLVELMGGKFELASELGIGTTITITLPLKAPERDRYGVKVATEVDAQPEDGAQAG